MCCHDTRGHDVIEACREIGAAVPDEVSVVAVENEQFLCTMSDPPMSSVEVSSGRIGYRAAALLHKMIDGRPAPRKPILLPPLEVVVRASSRRVAMTDPIVRAQRFIADNAGKPITVEDVLRKVLLSRSTIERRFREEVGHSPSVEILRAHVERSKRLLMETDEKMFLVGRNSGFAQYKAFYRTFRKVTGFRPAEFRQRYRSTNPLPPEQKDGEVV
jgi:LacI family transcriptional regulator